MDRRGFIQRLAIAGTLSAGGILTACQDLFEAGSGAGRLRSVVSTEEIEAWHRAKASTRGPALAGNAAWKSYVAFLETKLAALGVQHLERNSWTYGRWSTSEWPDDSGWSLSVSGRHCRVASYGAYSGATPQPGVAGLLALFEDGLAPDDYRGKVALVVTQSALGRLTPDLIGSPETGWNRRVSTVSEDYEYLSSPETFPDPESPLQEGRYLSPFPEMGIAPISEQLAKGGALAAVVVMGLPNEALGGIYTFPVPWRYDVPTVYVGLEEGARLVSAAAHGESARLRLISSVEESAVWQLVGYLPGRHYGTPRDENVLLITHTDGPSLCQENGALGILGVLDYFALIPRHERRRTLMILLDCRHYMPGGEEAFGVQNYASRYPDAYSRVVAVVGMEQLGLRMMVEGEAGSVGPGDKVDLSSIWVSRNRNLVDAVIRAVVANQLARTQVQCPGELGIHGRPQGAWRGLGRLASVLGVPGVSIMGMPTGSWSTRDGMSYLNAEHFRDQVATFCQICDVLMNDDELSRFAPEARKTDPSFSPRPEPRA